MAELLVIGITAVLTSIVSSIAGLGGGTVLLLVIAQFVAPTAAIPIQGAIQLASNGSRSVLLRDQISWPTVGWASLLVLPGSFLGVLVATSLPEDAIRVALAVFVLVLAWRPHWLKFAGTASSTPEDSRGLLIGVGAMSGFVNSTVGASGPMTSIFYKAVTSTHVAFVATAAAAQVVAHISKLVAFSAAGWRVGEFLDLIAIGVAGVFAGSWIGTRLLGRVSEVWLDRLFKVVLTVLAVRLILRAI